MKLFLIILPLTYTHVREGYIFSLPQTNIHPLSHTCFISLFLFHLKKLGDSFLMQSCIFNLWQTGASFLALPISAKNLKSHSSLTLGREGLNFWNFVKHEYSLATLVTASSCKLANQVFFISLFRVEPHLQH
ncbi:hypothetical protein HHK36_021105 [Tetracentron sinense]|uniref:Uncharacterized protein n=1 Tax=Tetracentron sinense TaxID=13715 RepID=A0A835D7I2_TETSI|nr:hypothetical protein HHK36_021105 [Tetracentron sinense]